MTRCVLSQDFSAQTRYSFAQPGPLALPSAQYLAVRCSTIDEYQVMRCALQDGLLGISREETHQLVCPMFMLRPLATDIATASTAVRERLGSVEMTRLISVSPTADNACSVHTKAHTAGLSDTPSATTPTGVLDPQQGQLAQTSLRCMLPGRNGVVAAHQSSLPSHAVRQPSLPLTTDDGTVMDDEAPSIDPEPPGSQIMTGRHSEPGSRGGEPPIVNGPLNANPPAVEQWAEAARSQCPTAGTRSNAKSQEVATPCCAAEEANTLSTDAVANQGQRNAPELMDVRALPSAGTTEADVQRGSCALGTAQQGGNAIPAGHTDTKGTSARAVDAVAVVPEHAVDTQVAASSAAEQNGGKAPGVSRGFAEDAQPLDLMAWYMDDDPAAMGATVPAWAAAAVPAEQIQQQQRAADAAAADVSAAGKGRGGQRGGRGRGAGRGRGRGRADVSKHDASRAGTAGGGVDKRQRKKRGGRLVKELESTEAAEASGALEVGYFAHIKQFEVSQRRRGAFAGQQTRQASAYSLRNGQTSDPRNK